MKFSIYFLAILAVLGGLLLFFKPESPSPPSTSTANEAAASNVLAKVGTSSSPEAVPPSPPPPSKVFEIMIRHGQLVSGPAVIQVHKGDDVIVRLTSDTSDELHLHGYDLHVNTRPGETTTLQFSATRTGRFGYELHHSKAELGALEVYPR